MRILLVRHADAGTKRRWRGDDGLRPLSDQGRREARSLALVLAAHAPRRLISSPLVRCVETLAPLVASTGLDVGVDARLLPDAGESACDALAALITGSDDAVVCTHGETIGALQATLDPGRIIFGPGRARAKASSWLLRFEGAMLAEATYLPPPG